ncbi:AraC family transcriptional regulator [Dyella sp. LX-66]|uniref:AraC family transcriptional regulator n=1 Tax=unclassified Dyella TaxID=2634549 RepID=UPI001BDF766D|nr:MULTISPECIES: AraC family transcriptional regulator [unclassified Dyella]MBT2119296.1 AraC family transcriptional regulator [Dyella sp. LX-1]MBT2141667.1 AraC family transcriptional regulator [Dyella sp. LX-66]
MDIQPSATPHDLASELLLGMRLVGVQYRRIEVSPPFGLAFGEEPGRAQFHFVARGPVFLRSPGGVIHRLDTSAAVLLPRGGAHHLLSSAQPEQPCRDIATLSATELCPTVRGCADIGVCHGERTLVFSGCMEFDLGGMQSLVAAMPEVMLVGTLLDSNPELRAMLDAMERESLAPRAGSAGILARLADVVSAFIVRGWVECGCGDASGWVEALRDPRLGKVLVALHRDPGRHWTVAELAAQMDSSRSVFAERFLAVTGMTPLRYLTELRMRLAAQWLSRDREPIESVAYKLGYGSLAAFSRAFKRVVGRPPGALRAHAPEESRNAKESTA